MRRLDIRRKVLVVTLAPILLTTLISGLFLASWINSIETLLPIVGGAILSMAVALGLSRALTNPLLELNTAVEDLQEALETVEAQTTELDFARKEALEASRRKSEFLAHMSHEIRTPLSGIIGFTELLVSSPMPRQQQDQLSIIRKSSEILLTIINDVLDFSKIEAGMLVLDRVPFRLRDIVADVMAMMAPSAHTKNLELVPLVCNDVPDNLLGDPLRIKQVITNLVNNAIKFTQTGEVVLRASLEEEDAGTNRVRLLLSITDSGPGLSRGHQQSLFAAFSQADASTARQYGGTGLGLAISKRLVAEMEGRIGLESEPGKGSTFWFSLTLERGASGEATAPENALRGERIIYLEHQNTTGLAVEHLLTGWGLVVDRVTSPDELRQRVASAQKSQAGYALAILGLSHHLPDSSQCAGLVRTLEIERDCRTLLLTPTLETNETPLSGLASGHLIKPVCGNALYNELLLLLHGIHAGRRVGGREVSATPAMTDCAPRVLAVDDNDANLKLIMALLEACQLDAECASSGFEALSKVRQQPFDLVFIDLQMPGMNGAETTRKLRATGIGDRQPSIIALTARADQLDPLIRHRFDGYIAKPISVGQLIEIIHSCTGYICPQIGSESWLQDCVNVEESIRLAAGKADLAEELFNMLLEQVGEDQKRIPELWDSAALDELRARVHKLHGAARCCGTPGLRYAANQLEIALQCSAPTMEHQKDQLLSAMERLQIWSDNIDWQRLFRDQRPAPETP